jgi:hypothetical protein
LLLALAVSVVGNIIQIRSRKALAKNVMKWVLNPTIKNFLP